MTRQMGGLSMSGSATRSSGRLLAIVGRLAALLALGAAAGLAANDHGNHDWRDYGGGPDNAKFSTLKQIDKSNVTKLEVAWTYPYGETLFNPIVARGVIYGKGRNGAMIALGAETGKEIWIHEGLEGMTRRGVNYWESKDGKDRRLIFSMSDYLQEIDAATGKSIRTFGTDGVVDLREGLGRDPKTIGRIMSNTPGKVFENLLLLGSATGEAYFSPPGDLRAYDVITGKLAWIFHTVPHPGEFGYDTWPKDAWKYAGGTNTWGEITIDPERAIAYFPTGSSTFDFYGADRHGANLFANCLIALDARTGKRLWHFQNVHHDLWDYDNTSAPQLTTIRQNGKTIPAVAMAGKTGFLYVFNRVTGAPIWPIEERPVPTKTDVPGEEVFPTQPFPTKPPPFARQKFTVDDINPYMLTPAEREQFTQRVAKARNEGLFTPIGFSEVIHMPGNNGGSNFGSTSANPNDGTVYVISYDIPAIMRLLTPEEAAARGGRGRGGPGGPGLSVFQQTCVACHGADRAGTPNGASLIGVSTRLSAEEIRSAVVNGKGRMPPMPQLSDSDVDDVVAYVAAADGRGGPGRGRGPVFTGPLPPGPVVESGPAVARPGGGFGAGGRIGGPQGYPEGVEAPAERYTMDGYGLHSNIVKPPFTTLTSYDLNKGTIKWQVPLGDDPRLVAEGVTGTGTAGDFKFGVIPTITGLVFVAGGDDKLHVYDAATGKQLWEAALGAASRGIPSMYELNGRQYLLMTASDPGVGPNRIPRPNLPRGYVAFALPGKEKTTTAQR
jgi:quinoprotein glucose dehydrogenase